MQTFACDERDILPCTSSSIFFPSVDANVLVSLGSGNNSTMGSPFTFACPRRTPQSAAFNGLNEYNGTCSPGSLNADYAVTASFT